MSRGFTFDPQIRIYSRGPRRDQVATDLVSALSLLRELPPYRNGVGPGWVTQAAHLNAEHLADEFPPAAQFPHLVPADDRAARILLAELRAALGHLREAHRQIHALEDLGRDEPLCTPEGRELAAEVLDYAQTVNGLLA